VFPCSKAPLSVDRQIVQGYFLGNNRRYWDWPQWDISTLSWLSKTQIGEKSYVKTNAYWNTFDNIVDFFRTSAYNTRLQESPYRDHSVGGFVEMGTDLIPMNTLKGAVHFRRDYHWEQALDFDANDKFTGYEPRKKLAEEDWSFAIENTFHAMRHFDVVTGVSYDTNQVLRADGTKFPLPDLQKWNWQTAAIYRYSRDGSVHADVSSRTRFPTLFDRYSTRFGGRTEEPDLNAERATNYELGWSDRLFKDVHISSAIFYSQLKDNINTAFSGANGNGSLVVYNADGNYRGIEFSADWDVTRTLRIGGNYTYLQRNLEFAEVAAGVPAPVTAAQQAAVGASQIEGTPAHEAFIYAAWKATRQLTLTPSMEIASDRNALITSCASTLVAGLGAETAANGGCNKPASALLLPNYTKLGAYTLLNFQAEYAFDANTTVAVGGTNLLDQNYELADGFPEAGRMFFANIRSKF
jgi:iron complex outermembrane receptor protein